MCVCVCACASFSLFHGPGPSLGYRVWELLAKGQVCVDGAEERDRAPMCALSLPLHSATQKHTSKGRTAWVHGLGRGSTGPAVLRPHSPRPGPGPTTSGHLQTALAYCGGRCSQEAQHEPHVSIFNVLVASPRWCVWLGGLSSSL